ncbi:MAG: asparagine synthase (glutamine-hydrolyzing) [Nitrospirae bacterium]|nr:asparagine synthase (glutamine-hydrolyzing) [Nitrospirota bacterium]
MCGIAGIFSPDNFPGNPHIRRMADTLRHRGPDDEGYLAADLKAGSVHHLTGDDSKVEDAHIDSFRRPANLFLSHRRLSIIDPSPAGHQPMCNSDKTLWIVYNGEIYNYLELKAELKTAGYDFKTHSDTEVLLAAYEMWGKDCLNRFNGMWSFVIYDRRKNILFGARDRFGVKPFYYYKDRDYFVFASEIKALVSLPFIEKKINGNAVFDYLVLGLQENEEEGFFRGVFELPPAFAFELDLSKNDFRKWRYYTLDYVDAWRSFDEAGFNEYSAGCRDLIFNAVRLRLRSDVPVGSCLSGGIDSSSIVCVINSLLEREKFEQVGERQKVFTASYDDKAIDESDWAKTVVDKTRTAWFQVFPKSSELMDDLEDLAYSQDIPFGTTSIYAQYRVMKLARENGVTVLLDGQGGDELFTGYTGYYAAFFFEMLRNLDVASFLREKEGLKNSPVTMKFILASLLKRSAKSVMPPVIREKLKSAYHGMKNGSKYLNDDFRQANKDRPASSGDRPASLNAELHELMCRTNLKNLLRYEDRNSMRFSIESRTPFADDINLIEYLFRVPSVYKIHNGWSKYILRESMKGIIPDRTRLRKDKLGFSTPEHRWLNDNKDELSGYIGADLDGFIDTKQLCRDWDVILQNHTGFDATNIWKIINLGVWKKAFGLQR